MVCVHVAASPGGVIWPTDRKKVGAQKETTIDDRKRLLYGTTYEVYTHLVWPIAVRERVPPCEGYRDTWPMCFTVKGAYLCIFKFFIPEASVRFSREAGFPLSSSKY